MNTCAVTIAGPDKRVDLVVSVETPIAELLPTFVELSVDEQPDVEGRQPVWAVSPPGKRPFPAAQTLSECGVSDGDVLVISQLRSEAQSPPHPAAERRSDPHRGSPSERTAAALPALLPSTRRMSLAVQAFFDHGPEAPIVESSEPRGPSIREQVTRAEQRSPLDRYRASWRETDYFSRLDRAVAAPRLLRCATIAVVSPKGGVGKTTTTALLGSLLARIRRDRAVAVDTNPDYGSLGRALTPDHKTFVDDLLEILEQPNLSVTELDAHLGRAGDGLMVLPAPTDPDRMVRLDEQAYSTVISRLQNLVGLLILDCGTGLQEPAARAALATADQIVLVSDAHPSTASLVAEAAELLRHAGPPMTLVVNKMPSGRNARIDLEGFEKLIPEAQGLVTIEDDQSGAGRVAAGSFSWEDGPGPWRRSVRELAVTIVADWPRLGIAQADGD